MIRLKKDGKYFDIAPGETITTEWVSTVFNDDDEFKGSYTYTIKAPFTPNNNALLNHANLIENRSARLGGTAVMEIFGQDWKQVKLSIGISPEGYELFCLIDNGEFANTIREKMLPEIFCSYKQGVFFDFVYDVLGNTPSETLSTMLDRAANPGKGSCVFVSQKNDRLFGEFNDENGAAPEYQTPYRINIYNNKPGFIADVISAKKSIFFNPSYYLVWVVRKVCEYLGFRPDGDFFNDPTIQSLIIDNTGCIDADALFGATGGKIAPSRHLPNIKIAEFIKMLRSTFKLAIYFDGKSRTAYFSYAPGIIHSTDAVDISGYTEKAYTIQNYTPSGFELMQGVDDDDDLFDTFEYVKNYFIGNNNEADKLDNFAGTLFMTATNEPRPVDGGTWRIPRKRQVGNVYSIIAAGSDAFNESGYGRNDFTFRLLNYRGIRYGSTGEAYYYASSDGRNPDATEEPEAIACWLGGTNGLINRFLKEWLVFKLRTEEVEITAYLPGWLLMKLSPLKRFTYTTRTKALIPAMFDQVSFEESRKYASRVACKIKHFPIYNQTATDINTFTEVTPGEVENPGPIYVLFRLPEVSREEIRFGNTVIVMSIVNRGILEFYSDEARTKPRSVTNLPINMFYQYRGANPRNYQDYGFTVIASGTSYIIQVNEEIGIGQTKKYTSSSDYWQKHYQLRTGADYIPLNTIPVA